MHLKPPIPKANSPNHTAEAAQNRAALFFAQNLTRRIIPC